MRSLSTVGAFLLLASAGTASAGPGGGCTYTTQQCVDHLTKDTASRGWVGIRMEPADEGRMKVSSVVAQSPAEKGGLEAGDVLVSVNGKAYGKMSEADAKEVHAAMKPGNVVTYVVDRGGSEKTIKVELAPMPEEIRAQMIGHHLMEHAGGGEGKTASGLHELSVDEVAKMVKAGNVTVVDANGQQTRDKFGVIPNAVLLTSYSEYDVKSLPKDKDTRLVFYCANTHCTASDAAAKRAAEAGYKNVAVLRAGIMGWKDAGQKTATAPQS